MKIVIPVIALSALIASGVSAWSGSPSTGKLQIKMKIDEECKVNPGGDAVLDFGNQTTLDANSFEGVGSIQVQCTAGVKYAIYLDAGKNSKNKDPSDVLNRRMINDKGDYLAYQLYQPQDRTVIWGSSPHTSISRGLTGIVSSGDRQTFSVYGKIEHAKNVVANTFMDTVATGTYTDTVTVEVRF
ncbi:hypothetical protein [Bacteriophage sp.]|nr:hypothetical protein [Bacteriophage sp.]